MVHWYQMQGIFLALVGRLLYDLGYALTVAMRVWRRVSNCAELMGISGVWKGFFMTASESGLSARGTLLPATVSKRRCK